MIDKIIKLFRQTIEFEGPVSMDTNLEEYGINSISLIKFLVELEDAFNMEFDIENMVEDQFKSLKDIYIYIMNNRSNK